MDAVKGYLVPKQRMKGAKKEVVVVSPVETTVTAPQGIPILAPLKCALSSRHSLIYPSGDFRNADSGSILDIRADMMVNWLHQQQMERLWSASLPGEGVVLKMARDSFACSPSSLRNEQNGFYDNVVTMNIRVSANSNSKALLHGC